MVKEGTFFKEREEAKAIPDGSNRFNENVKYLEKEAVCYFTDASKMYIQEFVAFLLGWILAYMGVVLNEVADALAKESIRKGEGVQYLILVTDLKSCWKTKLRIAAEEWHRESGKQKGRKYFENYYQNNGKPWFQRFKFQRKSFILINRIRNSHYCLKE